MLLRIAVLGCDGFGVAAYRFPEQPDPQDDDQDESGSHHPAFPMASALLLEKMRNESVQERDKVFTSYAEPTINQPLRKHTKLAGIDKHVTYHCSRHARASHWLEQGLNIIV